MAVVLPDFKKQQQKVVRRSFETTFEHLRAAKEWVLSVLTSHGIRPEPFHYAIESTACYHFPVLHAWQGEPTILNPQRVKLGSRKTDDRDARTLGEGDLYGKWGFTFSYPLSSYEPRVLLRRRMKAVAQASANSQAITRLLLMWGYTFQVLGSPVSSDLRPVIEDLCAGHRPLLLKHQACCSPLSMPVTIADHIIGCYQQYDLWQHKAKELWDLAWNKSICLDYHGSRNGPLMGRRLLAHLKSIPGVGDVAALTTLLEITDLRRFNTVKGCLAWAGYDPTLRVSAGKVTAYVTRKGADLVHHVLIESAHACMRAKNRLGEWGRAYRARQKKGGGPRAANAIARKILEGVYWCWLKDEDWRTWDGEAKSTSDS